MEKQMQTFSAKTLEAAIILASQELNCSVVDLSYKILQQPSSGFLGIGRKDAVIGIENPISQNDFKVKKRGMASNCVEIEQELSKMLSFLPYEIDTIKVTPHDKHTINIYLDGKDTALLIGEKGYRYKAFSYLLFNWIHPIYGCDIRLEVAQFLKIQEEIVENYLLSIREEILGSTHFQTKNLSGILGIIALRRLKEMYPGYYICLKNENNEQFVVMSMLK